MPFVSREQLDPKLRAKHEKTYKTQLRQALTNPSLTQEQKEALLLELKSVGGPKVYKADTPPKPGAIFLTAVPEKSKKPKRGAKNHPLKGKGKVS